MVSKAKSGDVFEIKTSMGLAYFQCVRRVPDWGMMIRVLIGTYSERPNSLVAITQQAERFLTFFPIDFAWKKKIVALAGCEDIPATVQRNPLFRAPGLRDREGRVMKWFLIDGDREIPLSFLTLEQKKLPIQVMVNDTALVEMIENNWVPEHQV